MRVVVKSSAVGVLVVVAVAALVLSAGSAIADGSGGSEMAAPASASSECPKSISERYPWIACRTTAMGTQVIAGPSGNDTWETSRILPMSHPFVVGDGYWGPDANR